jgi:hypothetical protein
MFGLAPVAALAIATRVERAVVGCVREGDPADRIVQDDDPAGAGLARIDAQLEAIREQLPGLKAAGHDIARVEEILAHACARIEEWTA